MKFLSTNSAFEINQVADAMHKHGLEDALMGDFTSAQSRFSQAQNVLQDITHSDGIDLQIARVQRDAGFTYVREASRMSDPDCLVRARAALRSSVAISGVMVSGEQPLDVYHVRGDANRARRELMAEHGATIGLLGRLATFEQVMIGIDSRTNTESALVARRIDQQPYHIANDFLRIGNNGYYRVSNAMTGARQEHLNGRPLHVGIWLGRAIVGLGWTSLHDPRNTLPAARTLVGRSRHLVSYRRARESLMTHP